MKYKQLFSNIIGIAGQTGSGKTTLASDLCINLNGVLVSFGSFVKAEAKRRGMTGSYTVLQQLGEDLIKELGTEEFVYQVLNSVSPGNSPFLIIDGIRHVEILKVIKPLSIKFFFIYLEIEEITRIKRLQQRDNLDFDSIQKAVHHPMEKNIPYLREYADIVLYESSIQAMIFCIKDKLSGKL